MIGNLKVSQCATDSMGAIDVPADTKDKQWKSVVKIGRTHLEDAVPLTVIQEWSGWAAHLDTAANRVEAAQPELYRLAAGGTAVGTELNAPTTSTTRSPLRSPA